MSEVQNCSRDALFCSCAPHPLCPLAWHHSHDEWAQAFPAFSFSSASMNTERTKGGEGLRRRLPLSYNYLWISTQSCIYTVIIRIERWIQSSGRNSIFAIVVNPIMQMVASLIIFKWIQFNRRADKFIVVNTKKCSSNQCSHRQNEYV